MKGRGEKRREKQAGGVKREGKEGRGGRVECEGGKTQEEEGRTKRKMKRNKNVVLGRCGGFSDTHFDPAENR